MKRALAIFIFLVVVFSLTAHDFNGEWYAKFELNYEEGVVFNNVEIKDDVVSIRGIEKEFRVLDNFYIIYDGKKYYYGTRHNMIVLYSLDDEYEFNRILFLKPLRE